MRIRTLKPEYWASEDIAALDWDTRLVFIGLWSYVDDNGVGRDVERLIQASLFPLEDDPRDTLARVSRALASLAARSMVARYTVDGRPYLHVTSWDAHQRIDRPAKPRYPLPSHAEAVPTCDDADPRETLATYSRDPRDILAPGAVEQGNRGTGEQGNRGTATKTSATPPSSSSARSARLARTARATATRVPDPFPLTDDLTAWARTECPNVGMPEHEKFMDYWRGIGGTRGRKVDWPATWRNWMRRAEETTTPARANGHSTADRRVLEGLAVAARFDERDRRAQLAATLELEGGTP